MTGPHLTPEREAEIRDAVLRAREVLADDVMMNQSPHGWGGYPWEHLGDAWNDFAPIARALIALSDERAALDAEREAHHLTRTALEASTVDLAVLARALRGVVLVAGTVDAAAAAEIADARAVENQRVLGLAVAEADKPHDGNER